MRAGTRGGQERAEVKLGRANTAVLRGEDDPSEWDDEELSRGRRRNPDTGRFEGPDPQMVPTSVQREYLRRITTSVRHKMASGSEEAIEYLLSVMRDGNANQNLRVKVAQDLLDRLGMKAPEQINLTADDERPPWMRALEQIIVVPEEGDEGVIDVEAIEPSEDEQLWEDVEEDDIEWEWVADDPGPPTEVRPEPEPAATVSPLTPPKHWRNK